MNRLLQHAVYMIAIAWFVGGCTKYQMLDALVPRHGYTLRADVRYGDLARQKLDVYLPVRGNGNLIVFLYGGSWDSGEKRNYRFVGQALASRGFVALVPDYRVYPQVTFPAFVEDAAEAFKWAHDHAGELGVMPDRVFLMGHSAGAHIAALLTLDGKYLKAVGLERWAIRATIGLSGPYDFQPDDESFRTFNMRSQRDAPPAEMEPVNFVDGRAPPMLLIHGSKDRWVDPRNSRELAEKIRAAGGRVEVHLYRELGHAGVVLAFAAPFRWMAPVLEDVCEYVRDR